MNVTFVIVKNVGLFHLKFKVRIELDILKHLLYLVKYVMSNNVMIESLVLPTLGCLV